MNTDPKGDENIERSGEAAKEWLRNHVPSINRKWKSVVIQYSEVETREYFREQSFAMLVVGSDFGSCNRMRRAEDLQFSVPLQGPENKSHFSGFVVALNVGSTEKIESPRLEHTFPSPL
jgi:hypothetical protein